MDHHGGHNLIRNGTEKDVCVSVLREGRRESDESE